MDLLGSTPNLTLQDSSWRIYSRNNARPPQFIGEDAKIHGSMMSEGCEIYGCVENSVLFDGVYVAPGAVVRDSVIMSGTRIEAGARVEYSIVDADTVISAGAVVGAKNDEEKICVIGTKLTVPAGMTIAAGDMVNEAKLSQLKEGGNIA